jgi:5-formyltetrahydrofolate cyclo-ligase
MFKLIPSKPVNSMTQPLASVKEEMQPNSSDSTITAPPSLLSRQDLRQTLIQRRKSAPVELRRVWDKSIHQQLLTLPEIMEAELIGVYSPIRCEPNLHDFYQELHRAGKRLALPVVLAKDCALGFFEWIPGDTMEKDGFGVQIPAHRTQMVQPATLLIPCVGYNTARYRLGYGGGFYDRTLAMQPATHSVGIAYQLAQYEFIAETFDLPMSHIITELADSGSK